MHGVARLRRKQLTIGSTGACSPCELTDRVADMQFDVVHHALRCVPIIAALCLRTSFIKSLTDHRHARRVSVVSRNLAAVVCRSVASSRNEKPVLAMFDCIGLAVFHTTTTTTTTV